MKKALSTALILGALYGTANAAPVTSPIYMPEAGKILSTLDIGYTTSKFDKTPDGQSDKIEKSWNINLEGKFGIMDRLALNYGFDFDFSRKIFDVDTSANFTNFYFGVTSRVYEIDAHKFDVILNVGQGEQSILAYEQVFVELGLRYGLDLDSYNLGFSVAGRYINDYERGDSEDITREKLKNKYAFSVKLENEFIFTDNFTVGLDLYLNMRDKIKLDSPEYDKVANVTKAGTTKYKSSQEYGFNLDANYALAENNYIGAYFDMSYSNLKSEVDVDGERKKDQMTYKFGLKYTSQF